MNGSLFSMIKKIHRVAALSAILLTVGVAAVSAQDAVYISPNNDGVKDTLTLSLTIQEKRYISEWNFIITDEKGAVVRTIGNKESRPTRITFKSFFKLLATPKHGVAVPSSVTWNGTNELGETVPDGRYFYHFTATDDNGNSSKTDRVAVVVDNTPPTITLTQPSDAQKFFGEGSKALLPIRQSGSVEDKWTGVIRDMHGNVVRTFDWLNSDPKPIDWNGETNAGVPAADGVYSYQIESTDRAGNKSPVASIANIIYSAEKPQPSIAINGSRYFSPNGDRVQDTIRFDVAIPAPATGNKLVSWEITIQSATGQGTTGRNAAKKTFSGTGTPPAQIEFDGRSDDGSLLAEGEWQAVVRASYLNGFEPEPVRSPAFVLDITKPAVTVRAMDTIFSPDGDGKKDTIVFKQTTSKETEWRAEIRNKANAVVKQISFGAQAPAEFSWDGLDEQGKLAADNAYTYRLFTTDLAGNSTEAVSAAFELNTGTSEVILTVQPLAFSPNGDRVQDTVTFTPVVKSAGGMASYALVIKDAKGNEVKSFRADGALPASIVWDGKVNDGSAAPDGSYTAALDTVSNNGSTAKTVTQPFTLDTIAPSVTVSAPYLVFSPDGDGIKDTIPIVITSSAESRWTGTITGVGGSVQGKAVRTFTWQDGKAESFAWDGTDESGNLAPDGVYRVTLSSTDAAGNVGKAEIAQITLDARPVRAFIATESEAFSPNGDGVLDTQKFTLTTTPNTGIETWKFEIRGANGKPVASWVNAEGNTAVPASIVWDGKIIGSSAGKTTESPIFAEGKFTAVLDIVYVKGNHVLTESAPFVSSVTPPKLGVRTTPEYFSPDNDGSDDDLFIKLRADSLVPFVSWSFVIRDPQNGKEFWRVDGKSAITEQLVWDGHAKGGELVQSATDYPYTFTVKDSLGMTSSVDGEIQVDVLVIRVGDKLKIQVPSIIFRSDKADFVGKDKDPTSGLDKKTIDNNIRVLKRIAEILNKFKDYTVSIEGHANNVSGSEAEETSTAGGNIPLVRLSLERAEYVKEQLKKYGVNADRLSTVGVGGRNPVAKRDDRDNWWKNRRVEFILNK